MSDKSERKKLAILRVLRETEAGLTSLHIAERLRTEGHEVSERTVRHHLAHLEREGFTCGEGRRGHRITERGLAEVEGACVIEKVGFLSARIDRMTYRMNFDLERRRGDVVVNVSLLRQDLLPRAIPLMSRVFAAGYAMGSLVTLLPPGQGAGPVKVGPGMVGIGTVCSITLNGAMLAHGIPTHSRFGALLELRGGKPRRFAEIITYEGTSIDPLEIFIKSGMTDYLHATADGNGLIGAGFREFPAESRGQVLELSARLGRCGLGGFMLFGWPGQPLLDVPVGEGRFGAVVIGGLNPVAILEESGIRVQSRALAALMPLDRLFPYGELEERARALGVMPRLTTTEARETAAAAKKTQG